MAAPLAAADISIHFIGLTPEMEENVRAHLMLELEGGATVLATRSYVGGIKRKLQSIA